MREDRDLKMSLLSEKTEALLELGISATVGCDSCIDHHVQAALQAGANAKEIKQTIDLARQIGGKPSLDCCDEAESILGSFEAAS